jgi:hypothetical protein
LCSTCTRVQYSVLVPVVLNSLIICLDLISNSWNSDDLGSWLQVEILVLLYCLKFIAGYKKSNLILKSIVSWLCPILFGPTAVVSWKYLLSFLNILYPSFCLSDRYDFKAFFALWSTLFQKRQTSLYIDVFTNRKVSTCRFLTWFLIANSIACF